MIADITPEHYAAILSANLQYVDWLSPLEQIDLQNLLEASSYARQINNGLGALIGFTSDCTYQSENLNWLRVKFDDFVYIDRVIVSETAQGKGYGRLLYEDLEIFARKKNYTRLVCEVNTLPDNPGSHRFHLKTGFTNCGEAEQKNGAKRVRYYEKKFS